MMVFVQGLIFLWLAVMCLIDCERSVTVGDRWAATLFGFLFLCSIGAVILRVAAT